MYNTKLDNFYNMVIKIKTSLSPSDLLNFIKDIVPGKSGYLSIIFGAGLAL